MTKKAKRVTGLILAGALVIGSLYPANADAAKKPKLNVKKATIKVKGKKKLKVKNTTKKVKWSIKKGKGVIVLKKKKKKSVIVKAKKVGKAVVKAKVGKKVLKCKITVKAQKKAETTAGDNTTTAPDAAASADAAASSAASSAPSAQATAAASEAASETPSEAATAAPETASTETAGVETAVAETAATETAATETVTTETATEETESTEPEETEPTDPKDKKVGDVVDDIVIDLSDMDTDFSTYGKMNLTSQLPEVFDLAYFESVKVTCEVIWADGADTSTLTHGKLALVSKEANLNGYSDDGSKLTYNATKSGVYTIDVSGDKGPCVGMNIQLMNENDSWSWPAGCSISITKVEFIAKEDQVYQELEEEEEVVVPEAEHVDFQYAGLDTAWIEENIDPSKPCIAFTFDDGPVGTADTTTSTIIQNALTEAGAHATFFLIGSQIAASDDKKAEVARIAERGFECGDHAYGWNSLANMDPDEIEEEFGKTRDLIKEITGYDQILFRAPNLAYSENMYNLIPAPFIHCAVDSKDWDGATTEQIIANVKKAQDGDIVLMHETQKNTAAAVPELLQWAKEEGIQIVSVSELFYIKGKTMKTGVQYSNAR